VSGEFTTASAASLATTAPASTGAGSGTARGSAAALKEAAISLQEKGPPPLARQVAVTLGAPPTSLSATVVALKLTPPWKAWPGPWLRVGGAAGATKHTASKTSCPGALATVTDDVAVDPVAGVEGPVGDVRSTPEYEAPAMKTSTGVREACATRECVPLCGATNPHSSIAHDAAARSVTPTRVSGTPSKVPEITVALGSMSMKATAR
jgi:hypothetical protein